MRHALGRLSPARLKYPRPDQAKRSGRGNPGARRDGRRPPARPRPDGPPGSGRTGPNRPRQAPGLTGSAPAARPAAARSAAHQTCPDVVIYRFTSSDRAARASLSWNPGSSRIAARELPGLTFGRGAGVGADRMAGRGWLTRGGPALVVTGLMAVGGAAGGGASAAAAAAGTISTVAGGVGGPGRATNVPVTDPCGVSVANGLLYIADGPTVRQVDATDRLTTPAGTGSSGPLGDGAPAVAASLRSCATAVDGSGNLLIADGGDSRVRVVAAHNGTFYGQAMTAKDIYTVAGNGTSGYTGDGAPAAAAELSAPGGLAVDGSGNLVITDTGNNVIRLVAETGGTFYGQAMTAGDIYTVAGNGTAGFSGDMGAATAAKLDAQRVTVDAAHNLVIADTANQRIRVVAATTGTFYGQAMTAGDIYTVAGNGTAGLGDGGPAASAEISFPAGMALDGSGNLLIADSGFARIRVVPVTTGTFY